jgi:hypothetical protein
LVHCGGLPQENTSVADDNNQSNDYALRFWVDVHSRQPASVNKPGKLTVNFSRLGPAALREK